MPVVYLDVVWLLNLVLDGFILLVTGFLARRPLKIWRMIGASVIGASYALFLFVPDMSALLTFLCKFLFSLAIVRVAFTPRGVADFAKLLGLFYLSSFVTGGAAYAVNGYFQKETIQNGIVFVQGGMMWAQQTKLFYILLALPLLWFLGRSAWNWLGKAKHREQNFWMVDIEVEGSHVACTGLLDTGNALTDPLSRTPVMVADWELFRDVLPAALTDQLAQGADMALALGDVEMDEAWQSRFRVVPYRGVGGTMGMLLCFKPDLVTLSDPGSTPPELHACKRVLVGLNPKRLAADGSYRAILHPAMLQEQERVPGKADVA